MNKSVSRVQEEPRCQKRRNREAPSGEKPRGQQPTATALRLALAAAIQFVFGEALKELSKHIHELF
jgi:hypothetical protein